MLYTGLRIAIAMGGFVGLTDAAPAEASHASAMLLAPEPLTIRPEPDGFTIAKKAAAEIRKPAQAPVPIGSTIQIDRRLLGGTPLISRRLRDARTAH